MPAIKSSETINWDSITILCVLDANITDICEKKIAVVFILLLHQK